MIVVPVGAPAASLEQYLPDNLSAPDHPAWHHVGRLIPRPGAHQSSPVARWRVLPPGPVAPPRRVRPLMVSRPNARYPNQLCLQQSAAAASPDAVRPASGSPAESPAMPRSPGKAVSGPLVPHLPIDLMPLTAGNRIDTTFMPRVAAQNTLRRHHRALRCAMYPQCLHCIFAATWPIPAMRPNKWTHCPLIHAHRADPKLRYSGLQRAKLIGACHTPVRSSARLMSLCRAMKSRPRVLSRPIRTRSTPLSGRSTSNSRAASFRRRRVRLRMTALPTFLVTVKPSLATLASWRIIACKTTPPTAAFLPVDATRKNSGRRFKRSGFAAVEVSV